MGCFLRARYPCKVGHEEHFDVELLQTWAREGEGGREGGRERGTESGRERESEGPHPLRATVVMISQRTLENLPMF